MERLVEQYKGTLMENSRLTHAARLAAKQHVLLASPEIPPATKKIRVKALGPAVRRATRRVRVMSLPGAGGVAAAGADDDDDEFAQGPMETFLKTLIKRSTPQPKAPQTITGTPKGKPKIPPKTPISLPLPDNDWEEELAAPIPSTSKSKESATLSKGKSPLSVLRPPLDRQETQPIWTGGQRGYETGQLSAQVEMTTRLERVGGEGSV